MSTLVIYCQKYLNNMKIFLHTTLLLVFCLWLIPLGQFIGQDRQAQLCGGQRAVCMCLVSTAKKVADGTAMLVTNTSGSSSHKESAGVGGHYFDAAVFLSSALNAMPLNFPPMTHLSSSVFLRNIEHIPKA